MKSVAHKICIQPTLYSPVKFHQKLSFVNQTRLERVGLYISASELPSLFAKVLCHRNGVQSHLAEVQLDQGGKSFVLEVVHKAMGNQWLIRYVFHLPFTLL